MDWSKAALGSSIGSAPFCGCQSSGCGCSSSSSGPESVFRSFSQPNGAAEPTSLWRDAADPEGETRHRQQSTSAQSARVSAGGSGASTGAQREAEKQNQWIGKDIKDIEPPERDGQHTLGWFSYTEGVVPGEEEHSWVPDYVEDCVDFCQSNCYENKDLSFGQQRSCYQTCVNDCELLGEDQNIFPDRTPCEFLYSPTLAEIGSTEGTCYDDLLGSDRECSPLACDITRRLPDINELSGRVPINIRIFDYRDKHVMPEFQESLEYIIRAAWALLQENLDLVEWASCWVHGPGSGNCLLNFLDGRFELLRIHLMDRHAFWEEASAGAFYPFFIRSIFIYTEHEYWRSAMSNWHAGNVIIKTCVALDVATLLAHELSHICLNPITERWGGQECSGAQMMESALKWALYAIRNYNVEGNSLYNGSGPHRLVGRFIYF